MANAHDMRKQVEFDAALSMARAAKAAEDAPTMETRPDPNDEQHRTFELAMRHRAVNERYAALLEQYEAMLSGFAHSIGRDWEGTA